MYVCLSVFHSDDNLSKPQSIFTKLGMWIYTVVIWFWIANFNNGGVLQFNVFISPENRF